MKGPRLWFALEPFESEMDDPHHGHFEGWSGMGVMCFDFEIRI